MKYALRLDDKSLPHMVERAKRAEAAGFDALWAGELQGTPFVNCAAVAGFTERIRLGTAIAHAFARTPLTTALTSLDVDKLTEGRFVLGLSTSLPRIVEQWHNQHYGKPIGHIKEYIELTRLIMERAHTGKTIEYKGDYYDVRIRGFTRAWRPVREKIPIIMGAVGPNMIRTAAEVADGVVAHPVFTMKYIEEVMMPQVEEGIKRSGRDRKDFEVILYVDVIVTDDHEKGLNIARGTPAFYSTVKAYQPFFDLHGFQEQAQQIREIFRAEGWGPKINEAVTDDMAEAFAVIGSPDQVRDKMKRYEQYADSIIVSAPVQGMRRAEGAPYEEALFEVFGS